MKRLAVVGFALVAICHSDARAQVPRLVHYQGTLKSGEGETFSGVVDLEFAIYKSPLAETAIWTETHRNVRITAGEYEVMLGSQNPLNLSFYEYFLDVRQNGQESSQPRVRIVGSGYNFRLWFLFAAYTVVWLGLSVYLFSISHRQKKLISELQSLVNLETSRA